MGASGLSQLITMEVSPTSSTSCSVGASGATKQTSYKYEKDNQKHRLAVFLEPGMKMGNNNMGR